MGEATPIGSSPLSLSLEAQAAWARPLRSSTSTLSSPSSLPLQSCRSLSLSLFWWLVVLIVGGWLILVDGGRLIGFWVWDLGWYWCLSLGWLGWLILVDRVLIVVFVWVFFFGSSGWYWWSVVDQWGWPMVDMRCGLLLLLLLLMIMGEGIIYCFNV